MWSKIMQIKQTERFFSGLYPIIQTLMDIKNGCWCNKILGNSSGNLVVRKLSAIFAGENKNYITYGLC